MSSPFDYADEPVDLSLLPPEILQQVLEAQARQQQQMPFMGVGETMPQDMLPPMQPEPSLTVGGPDATALAGQANQIAGQMRRQAPLRVGPATITNRDRQAISKRALAGYEPTAEQQELLLADLPRLEQNSETLANAGAELTGLPSIMRGADNVSRGWDEGDPWRTAGGVGQVALGAVPGLAVARAPAAALLAGTMPRAAATGAASSVPLGVSDAHAASGAGIARALDSDPEVTRLRGEISAKEAERTRIATQPVKGMSAASADKARATASTQIDGDIARLNEQVNAAQKRVEQEYRANAPFRERYPGVAEALFAGSLGVAGGMPLANTVKQRVADFALNRPGPTGAEKAVEFAKNAALGSAVVFEGSGLPEQVDALSFSPGHPTREKARAELTSGDYYGSRVPAALLSGVTGTALGTEVGKLITPGPRQAASGKAPPAPAPAPAAPPAPAPEPQTFRSYSQLPDGTRQNVRDAYQVDRALRGGDLPPKEGAQAIRESLERAGVIAPVTPRRVAETNSAWTQAEQNAGRPLTRAEARKVWTDKTLSLSPFVAAGAGAVAAEHHIRTQNRDPETGRLLPGRREN